MFSTAISLEARPARNAPKGSMTLKSQMEVLHREFGVNFVYDSSIDLDIPYTGTPMDKLLSRPSDEFARPSDASLRHPDAPARHADASVRHADAPARHARPDRASLEDCLRTLFADTGITYEIMKKYIVLTKADSRKKPKDYTIFIEEQTDTLDESSIIAYVDRRHNTTQTGLQKIDGSIFRRGYAVLGSPDLIKELQNLPGVSGGTELLSGMYVHGGDGTDNLFLLDGVPLYQVSHLAGLVSSFNTEVIDNLDFYKSGFPSRYGGKTSSVVDITTRPGNFHEYNGSFNIGLLNGGLQVEGPIIPGKTSFNLAVRRTWFDVLTIPYNLIANLSLPYGDKGKIQLAMTDLNASVTHLFDKDSRLSINFYAGSDHVRYKWTDLMVKYWEGIRHTGESGYDINVRWGNILSSLAWHKEFSDELHLNTVLYYVRSNNDVAQSSDRWELKKGNVLAVTDMNVDERNYSRLHDLGAKAELDWIPSEYHHLRTGVSYVSHLFRPVREVSVLSTVNDEPAYTEDDSYSISYNASEVAAYAEDEIAFSSWLKANLGLRYDMFSQGGSTYHSLEPRAALRLQLGQMAALKMSYSEMSQAVHLLHTHYLDIPMSSWMPSTDRVPPMRSRQAAGGVYMNLPHGIVLNVEGYWKMMDNLYEYSGIESMYPDLAHWEYQLMKGKGRSYGAEVELGWKTEDTDISAYYTLSWTDRFFEGIWHDWYPARNDNRHKFTFNASHRFSRKFDMYVAWNYHSGDRMTVPTQTFDGQMHYASPYNYKLPDYHRLDLGFNFRKTTRRGHESIWNLTLYNAYCRMNPMFAMLEHAPVTPGSEEYKTEFKTMAAIPIIPSFNYTLRF